MDAKSCDCVNDSSIPQTCIVYNEESVNDACFSFAIPGIALAQQPSEALDLVYSARYYCDVDDDHHLHKYSLRLEFRNNLHELTRDYGYEIIGKALLLRDRETNDNSAADDGESYHQLLFAHRRRRIGETIEIQEIFNVRRSRVVHLCFCIRRFKGRKSETAKEEDIESVNYGAMLLRTGAYSDVGLLVGERRFAAHKRVLAARSPVFRAMFAHGDAFAENQSNVVRIEELDAEVVEQLLAYVYTGKAPSLETMPRELFEAAHRYELHGLRAACEEFFVFGLNRGNVIEILEVAGLYELEELRERAMSFVRNHEREMAEEESFREFLCRDLRVNSVADTLKMCVKYELEDVKAEALEYVKEHSAELAKNAEFLGLFNSHPDLMREIYVYVHK